MNASMKQTSTVRRLLQGLGLGLGLSLNLIWNTSIPVEGIEFSNSHLGTFEGQTIFELSSDTGILPTLELEVENRNGELKNYIMTDQSLTVSKTKEGTTIKRAVLKGQTLENLVNQENQIYSLTADGSYQQIHIPLRYDITDTTKKFFLSYRVVTNTIEPQYTNFGLFATERYNNCGLNSALVGGKIGQQLLIQQLSKSANYLRIYINNNIPSGTLAVTDIMLIEYQDGMENWDIPYFEGSQVVQQPVLTITNGEPKYLETAKGQQLNPDYQEQVIRFKEPLHLRSNGDIHDELDLMTGVLTQRIDDDGEILKTPIIRRIEMEAEPIFQSSNQANVNVVGTIHPTIASVVLPTEPLSFVINPNEEPEQQFIASEFRLINETQAPLMVELKEFVQVTNILEDVLPDHYDSWESLTKEQSKSIALGLVPQPSPNWLTLETETIYAASEETVRLGRMKQKSSVDFKFIAKHGRAFESLPQPQYRLTFVFGF